MSKHGASSGLRPRKGLEESPGESDKSQEPVAPPDGDALTGHGVRGMVRA